MISETDATVCEKQQARAELRETFLRIMTQFQGQPCSILTYEKSKLEATFSVWKPDGSEILVQDLKTPANLKMQTALLRTPDVLTITFDTPIAQ